MPQTIEERLRQERNLDLTYDQHNKVRFETYIFGIVFFFGLIMLLAMPLRYCVVAWPPNVPCLKYAYGGPDLRVFTTALFITCLFAGGFALLVALLSADRLPQIGDGQRQLPRYESETRPGNAMIEVSPGRFVLPKGISQFQWRLICNEVARDDAWYFSRRVTDRLKPNNGITNEQFTDLRTALEECGAIVGNSVQEGMQHIFTSPTPARPTE